MESTSRKKRDTSSANDVSLNSYPKIFKPLIFLLLRYLYEQNLYNKDKQESLEGLIGIAYKYAFDALEKESILLCKNGLWCFESFKDG